jgi:hypothetical protein
VGFDNSIICNALSGATVRWLISWDQLKLLKANNIMLGESSEEQWLGNVRARHPH